MSVYVTCSIVEQVLENIYYDLRFDSWSSKENVKMKGTSGRTRGKQRYTLETEQAIRYSFIYELVVKKKAL